MVSQRQYQKRQISWKKEFKKHRTHMGLFAVRHGVRAASKTFGMSYGAARYWSEKVSNPNYHSQSWGGLRGFKWRSSRRKHILLLIRAFTRLKPLANVFELKRWLAKHGHYVSVSWLRYVFKKWRWSFKRPEVNQRNKFRLANIIHYVSHCYAIRQLPYHRLKYMDESSFKSKDLLRKKAIGPIGSVHIATDHHGIELTYTMTLLTSLAGDVPVVYDLHTESNTQWDFLRFVMFCIQAKYLVPGDYLVVDNASIHRAEDTWPLLITALNSVAVSLVFLPKYSPELNPCELVFAQLKNHLRDWRGDERFWLEIIAALSKITRQQLFAYYNESIETIWSTGYLP